MKIAPDVAAPLPLAADAVTVRALAAVKPAKPVQARSMPPLVVQPHTAHEPLAEVTEAEEKRHDPHVHGERRTYCRRIEHLPVLLELRSGRDRRRHSQRADDMTEHIDVSA